MSIAIKYAYPVKAILQEIQVLQALFLKNLRENT